MNFPVVKIKTKFTKKGQIHYSQNEPCDKEGVRFLFHCLTLSSRLLSAATGGQKLYYKMKSKDV